MESINHDLQASYSVIKLLEGSNINSERVLQSLPGVFCIINERDEILRGNESIALYLNTQKEDILRQPFSHLFSKEGWNVFSDHLKQLRSSTSRNEHIDFELGIEASDMISGEKAHYWHLRKMNVHSRTEGDLIIIIGEDISQLRESERQLNEIFSSIPLGIFTVNSFGVIEPFFSAYLTHLLDKKDIPGKSIRELLFNPALDSMTNEEKEGVISLDFVLGQGAGTYDMLEPFFPKQIFYPIPGLKDGGRWLKVIYQPVVYDDVVKRLLIILEDRTEIIKAREMKKKEKLLEDRSVQRVFQLKLIDKKGLHLYIKELNNLVKRLYQEKQEISAPKQLFATVHGIKGIARVAGFSFLKTIAHDLETVLQNLSGDVSANETEHFDRLFDEFSELFALYKALYPNSAPLESLSASTRENQSDSEHLGQLFSQYNTLLSLPNSLNKTFQIDQLFWGLLSYHYSFAHTLEEGLVNQSNTTAEALCKKVKIVFDWGNVLIKAPVLSALNECLNHLITNAIDHGIEKPAERSRLNKEEYGTISVVVSEHDSILTCSVTDDGAGIDCSRIRETAAQKHIRSTIELAEMDDYEILQLIFHPGFSTSDRVSDTSGRGIGMEAVTANLERFRGAIHIDSRKGMGTTFQLRLQLIGRDDLQFVKRCHPLIYFKKVITDYIEFMAKENGFELEMTFEKGFDKGVFYGDLVKAIVCFSSYIGNLACKGRLAIQWSLAKKYYIKCCVELVERSSDSGTPIQFAAPLQLSNYFIHQDKGVLLEEEEKIDIQIPSFFHAQGAPILVIGYTARVNQKLAKSTFKMIKEVAAELDISVEFSSQREKVNMLIYPSFTSDCTLKKQSLPGIAVSSSKKMIQQDLLKGIEHLVAINRKKAFDLAK